MQLLRSFWAPCFTVNKSNRVKLTTGCVLIAVYTAVLHLVLFTYFVDVWSGGRSDTFYSPLFEFSKSGMNVICGILTGEVKGMLSLRPVCRELPSVSRGSQRPENSKVFRSHTAIGCDRMLPSVGVSHSTAELVTTSISYKCPFTYDLCLLIVLNVSRYIQWPSQPITSVNPRNTVTICEIHADHQHEDSNAAASSTNDIYYFEVKENSKAGTFVGRIPTKPGFTYRFSEDPQKFVLMPQTGVILTSDKPADRETKDFYDLVVLSSSPTYPLEVKIKILDMNDNAPYWPAYINPNITFSESAPVGTKLIIETAIDLDEGNLNYEIVPDPREYRNTYGSRSPFKLSYNISSSFLHLEVCDKLDRETRSNYTVNISAIDDGGLTAYLVLNVQILDVNDNSPIFDHSDYSVSLNESIGKSVSILQVRATDADEEGNENSEISYYLLSEDYFTIDPLTGIIFTAKEGPLDCGTSVSLANADYKKICVFTVFANDHGIPRQNGRAYVTINLLDNNDHDPQIKFRYFSRSDHAIVDENTANGSVVAAVSVVDLDHGANGETTLAIVDGNQFGHFRLESIGNSHIIRVNGSLDREKISRYNLTITAHDHGTPPRSSTANLIISVNDVNDHEQLNSAIFVSEDAPVGYKVFDASSVSQSDSSNDNRRNYKLVNCSVCDQSVFAADLNSGKILLKNAVDRESRSKYVLEVKLSDGAFVSLRKLEVIVTDVNDNPPFFNQSSYSFDIPENTERGVVVGKIEAHDIDEVSTTIVYKLVSKFGFDNPLFALNEKTGQFTLTRHLDYESDARHYILLCEASDGVFRSKKVHVYFNVVNVNDNRPIFDPMSYRVEVLENQTIDSQIICVSATDADMKDMLSGDSESGDDFSPLRYYFQSGENGSDLKFASKTTSNVQEFEIDEMSGCIKLVHMLDRETKSKYDLIVVADDGKFKASATVQISIKDTNDNAPKFDAQTPTILTVPENQEIDSVIYTFKAIDLDEVPNNYIQFELENDWKAGGSEKFFPFSIGSIDGLLRLTGKLDRETLDTYFLLVRAKDYGLKSSEVHVTVQVLDVNDNAPQFEQSEFRVNLPENTSIDTRIIKFKATDLDSPDKINYRISSGDLFGHFKIVDDELVLVSALDYEQVKTFDVKIEAIDVAGNFDFANVHIEVTNVHDEAPKFLNAPFYVNWPENEIGVLGQFEAIAEVIANQYENRITYLLKNNSFPFFDLNSTNAVLKVVKPIDRESMGKNSIIELTVIAIDKRLPRLTGEGFVYINVTDLNDNEPSFSSKNYEFSLQENQIYYAKEAFGKLVATDEDPTDVINFEIVEPEAKALFFVESRSGEISLQSDLIFDREMKSNYRFTVLAKDGKYEDTATVNILIGDVNDCKPMFVGISSAHISFPQQSKVEMIVSLQMINSLPNDLFVFGLMVSDCDQQDSLNSRIEFSIENKASLNQLFIIDKYTGVVRLTTIPDGNVFRLNIIAEDSATTDKLSSQLTVELKIINDERSKQMRLLQQVATVSVSESEKVNKVIYHFQVMPNRNGVKLSILGGDPYDQFKIDHHFLRISKPLDYERTKFYDLFIKVSEKNKEETDFEIIKMRVEVINENDNRPTFDYQVYNATIIEEVEEPIMVTQLFASDLDNDNERSNGKLKYSIIEPLDAPFRIDPKHGTIWTTSKVDRELHSQYNLVVAVEDETGLSSTCRLCVTVQDKNDNPPRFTRLFSANITENSPVGTFVIQVTSSDKDVGAFAQATYSFIGTSEVFEIEPTTGEVFVIGSIDREVKDEYLLMVSANDGSWKAQTTLTINILDLNDNPPKFESDLYEFRREVNSKSGSIGVVKAVDPDKGMNALVSYSFKQRTPHFVIDSHTGEIFLKRQQTYKNDLELFNRHNLTVIASDKGSVPQSASASVIITIVPNTELSGSVKHKSIEIPIPINLKNNTVVYKFNYTVFLKSEISGKKVLETLGDKVQYKGEGLVEIGERFAFKLKSVHEEVDLLVRITEANEYSPIFTSTQSQVVVNENEDVNSVLTLVKATDADSDKANSAIHYELTVLDWKWNEKAVDYYHRVIKKKHKVVDSNDFSFLHSINQSEARHILYPFRLEPSNGTLMLQTKLDYELITEYRIECIAKDSSWFHPKNASTFLNVNVIDINDNVPIFANTVNNVQIMEVFENNPIGHVIGKVTAIDFDSLRYSQINYELANNYDSQMFTISSKTGQIQVLISFDFEQKREFKLEVIAKNDNSVYSSVLVIVKVKNVNEFKPKFNKKSFEFNLVENSPIGTVIGSLKGSASDEDFNDTIYYCLIMYKKFGVDMDNTGLISIRSVINFEAESHKEAEEFRFTVIAKNAGPIRSESDYDEATLIINLIKANGSPMFNQSTFSCKYGETHEDCKDQYSVINPGAMSVGHLPHPLPTSSPSSTLLHPPLHNQVSNHSQPTAPPPPPPLHKQRPPDVIESPPGAHTAPPLPPVTQRAPPPSFLAASSDNYSDILAAAEHYDLENASSIAPSDIDIVYHYKGFNSREMNVPLHHRHAPLARLSPSVSELTAPRILTLQDLSPSSGVPPCPPPPPSNKHQPLVPSSKEMDSIDDDDDANTDDSFTCSEFDNNYDLSKKEKGLMF
ncbi:cadherin-related tumor suppressor-like protein [Dinothrombium tinctorium]|uniref:Cadherin-related tumor suppressor-like protein n=1 Tax=Dinothrombium tinctorium TaxID=1965070 RepID=A0A3S3QVP5_9ACAR|nr:cadherin-related tumor suppressor-like protein [Dinothrombium tinctorium]RWS14741.1 cadherin-related tumor suppressor-like protein [Dinothrombium tinctorium]